MLLVPVDAVKFLAPSGGLGGVMPPAAILAASVFLPDALPDGWDLFALATITTRFCAAAGMCYDI